MFSEIFYVIRSRRDGQYIMARPMQATDSDGQPAPIPTYLLLFKEHFDALTYLNTHSPELADQFTVESMASNQLGSVLQRWDFTGIGVVQDPLLPQIDIMDTQNPNG
ncbi:hypothetical protein [Thermocoleostomius sinensis]|jgi:hypothetical protein|uniref:Uncharacterized protein n=1 Tax=Thermocoleostomius sinensis A174 TaxID=2016057 RepID=A0A9E8ZJ69_9CYAN|nr:hypothetical protein [Thermocoleostomius sinensis]WAL62205.1 hypothetical protein OXH18_09520 [Thermocoleostomius sinensis A174]